MEKPYEIEFSVTYVDLSTKKFAWRYETEEIRDAQYEAVCDLCERGYDRKRIVGWCITRSNLVEERRVG